MSIVKMHPLFWGAVVCTLLFTAACKKDSDNAADKGQLSVEITDGPCDDPNVKAVFVTVAEVKVDGQTFSGFSSKKTINLLSYQQGATAALGLGDLEAGNHQSITLVLDNQTDANGNAPGCYVQTVDNVKHALSTTATQSITTTKNFAIASGATTSLVLDLDLRKAVQYQNGSGADHYDFVADANLQTALRAVVKSESGSFGGTCQNAIVNTDKIIVYAYKKGQFDRNVEIQESNGIMFKNAVASTAVHSNGEFKLAFLENGDYELHFAAYKDLNSDDKLDFQGTLIINSLLDLDNIRLGAEGTLQLGITVTGILP